MAGSADLPGIVVAGAGLAGLRTVEALRRLGWTGAITVVGDEPHMPYTRPPLSKKLLLEGGEHASVELRRRDPHDGTAWMLGRRVESVELAGRRLTLDDGTSLGYRGLVIATGVRPRRLPAEVGGPRVVLRTIDDAQRLASRLVPGVRVVIVGAGFIGCEVAATALKRGCQVTVVAADPVPMLMPLGAQVGEELRRRHSAAGIDFCLGTGVRRIEAGKVELSDGRILAADVVVEAIGSVPSVDWLAGNGLDLANGVVTDGHLRVLGNVGVVAVGDVARFPNARYDAEPRRVEHWQIAVDTATFAAATLLSDLGGDPVGDPFGTIPSFWSDQGRVSIRAVGQPGIADEIDVLEGDLEGEAAIGYRREGRLVGVVLLGMPKALGGYLARLNAELDAVPV